MRAVVRLVFLTALRDRLFSGLAGLSFLMFGLALFMGNAALVEQSQAGLVFAAGSIRVVLILGLAVFSAFQTQRLFESREIEAILSRQLSRPQFVIAYWLGFAITAIILVVPVFAVMCFVYGPSVEVAAWAASLLVECLVVLAFTQFASLSLERATTTIFVTFAFYAFARLIGFFLGIRDATPDIGANRYINPMLDGLGLVLPRIDLMTQSRWLVYGLDSTSEILIVMAQGVVFVALVLTASTFDLKQKQF